MRKLRDDIRVAECGGLSSNMIHTLYVDIKYGTVSQDYPDSFYEQPPIGCFGKFWDDDPDDLSWSYLIGIDYSARYGFCTEDRYHFKHFTPGLPDDVDADGMPKP